MVVGYNCHEYIITINDIYCYDCIVLPARLPSARRQRAGGHVGPAPAARPGPGGRARSRPEGPRRRPRGPCARPIYIYICIYIYIYIYIK